MIPRFGRLDRTRLDRTVWIGQSGHYHVALTPLFTLA